MKNIYKVNEEAVKKIAEKVYDNGSTVINRNDLKEMFPELTESDDEKIRKDIIKAFKVFKEKQAWVGHCLDNIDWDACISWLENQSESDIEEPNFFDDFRKTDSEVEPKFHEGEWVICIKNFSTPGFDFKSGEVLRCTGINKII